MSARRLLLLLPAAAALAALTACTVTAAPGPDSTASAPSPAAPADGTPGAPPTAATGAAGDVASAACPSGATLQKLVELPEGVTFGGVECVQGWAGADPQGPNVGDGVYLFRHTAGTGWKYYGEGSGYDCADLGVTEPAPFCISG
ncbi:MULTISPECIES: hypothetical protein [Micromonospora]|uniref:Secreted protein n=1 Tax=Micromonospora yangpuensis TaxID=683228 RepID=A0A1C6U092_9ACTN|nr:hypothetical protein [Micromonospora yangpuensis]GGM11959.1 hypothetical protein GCM10012279_32580 [Micromonospora yangpuensis]SCL47456.1 hypothetical protein GA0070617_0586 [Micromonospora yangpuensis]